MNDMRINTRCIKAHEHVTRSERICVCAEGMDEMGDEDGRDVEEEEGGRREEEIDR